MKASSAVTINDSTRTYFTLVQEFTSPTLMQPRDSQRVPSVSELNFRQAVAAEVKARRGLIGISQEKLAFRARLHRTFIARLEVASTQLSLSVTFQLAEALLVAPEELFRLRGARSILGAKFLLTES